MYPLLISLGLGVLLTAVLVPLPLAFGGDPLTGLGPFLGVLSIFPSFILLSRRAADQIAPLFQKATAQAQAGNVPKAIETLEQARQFKRWQFFLDKQVNTQIGTLLYAAGDEKKAIEYLKDSYPRASEGHLMLAAALYREKQVDDAKEALENGLRFNKKSALLWNFLAWIYAQEKQTDKAIDALERGLKALGSDGDTQENLTRLREDKKLNMKPFGQYWFMLKFETMPGTAAHGAQPLRKGFRQQPKNKGKQKPKQKGKKAKKR